MTSVLVLGHNGMLGRTVARYFTNQGHDLLTLGVRFGDTGFTDAITNLKPDCIINCIGKIPQKNLISDTGYTNIHPALPILLDTLGIPVIHPTTDCEFRGDIPPGESYSRTAKRNAEDTYGKSKARASELLEATGQNTKIIRTSIIGHEETTSLSLLDWFLTQSAGVHGYTNHYWNGITTLQWAKIAERLINNWDNYPILNQFGTSIHHSKFDVLVIAKDIYNKDITIEPFITKITINKCLLSDSTVPNLKEQLVELKAFFGK